MSKSDEKYKKMDQREHVLLRPSMYIGGTKPITENMWILEDTKIVEKEITYIPGLYKIFDEIIVNAYDQSKLDTTLREIRVDIDPKSNQFIVYNDGQGIEVKLHSSGVYIPELIFSELLTGSNFDDSIVRTTGGMHGLGAKLTNIFSKSFNIDIGDPKNKKRYQQTYSNNLSKKSTPKISPYNKSTGYVRISYIPDLKYFGLTDISNDVLSLFYRRVYDISALTRPNVKVYLNNKQVLVNNFKDYVKLYTKEQEQDDNDNYVVEKCNNKADGYVEGRWEIIIAKSDGNYKDISFVNGIYTNHGGKHIDHIMSQMIKMIKDRIESKYKTNIIKDSFIKSQFWVFINSVIENPEFSSQSKEQLVTPSNVFGSACTISSGFLKKMFDTFDIDTLVIQYIKSIESSQLEKTGAKKKSKVKNIPKLYDANYAGTKRSNQCTLILTEGDSAKTMAIAGLGAMGENGTNYFGVFPLRGKLINIREAGHKKIINNEEFINIQKILGITPNKVYNENTLSELRYGSVMLMMDADVDGSHIKGLVINMFEYYWPTLLKLDGFLKMFITPVVKVKRKQEVVSFFTLTEYEKFQRKVGTGLQEWTIKYYKGLGTSSTEEAKGYFKNLDKHIIKLKYTDKTQEAINLAFSSKEIESRKNWLKKYDREIIADYTKNYLSYVDFIHKELIHFSNYDNIRSIPSLVDGLKPSQRKVLYACFKRNLTSDVKVAQLVGYISEHTAYHHGEISLEKTIIGMAQNFKGSNNLNLLLPNGQFGSLLQGGRDHSSARYIFTQLNPITRYIFHKDDDTILTYLEDDGTSIEPEYYVPIIPIILVNGSEGIGTGYSTYIPQYNPINIIDNLINKLKGKKMEPLDPWYRHNTGKIVKVNNYLYYSKGSYEKDKNKLIINELPLTQWTEKYKMFLENELELNIRNNSTESTVHFSIKMDMKEVDSLEKKIDNKVNGVEKKFKLVKNINLTNMHLYDSDLTIKKYKNPLHIMEEFYDIRLNYYDKRKNYLLEKLKKELDILEAKVKFINLIISKQINIFNKKKDEIIKILKQQKLLQLPDEPPYDYLIRMNFYNVSKEKVIELTESFKIKQEQYAILKKKKIQDIWLDDLLVLRKMIEKEYEKKN